MENEILQQVKDIIADENFAVGNDLVFVPDFEKSLSDEFRNKVYTANEMIYCDQFADSLLRYASTWAAKEAVYKAIKQINPSVISWKKIEIIREKIAGRPDVIIHKDLNYKISLSISHDGDYVWAVAIIKSGLQV